MARSPQQEAVFDAFARWQRGELELAPVTGLLGITPVDLTEGRVALAMHAGASHHNAFGTVHGGLLCAFSDVAMGLALASIADGEGFVTLEQHMNHLRAPQGEDLQAEAWVQRRGRHVAHLESRIVEAVDRELARGSSVCHIFPLVS